MFIDKLNQEQQGALLSFADKIILSDGNIANEETSMLNVLRMQMIPNVKAVDIPYHDLPKVFATNSSRIALILELLGIAHADGEYHYAEKDIIGSIATQLEISDLAMNDMESWVVRQLALVREATQFMEE